MFQIKYQVCNFNGTQIVKKIEFGSAQERNLEIAYGITIDSIGKNNRADMGQFLIICCFRIVEEMRNNTGTGTIQEQLQEFFNNTDDSLDGIRDITIEATVDSIPKKRFQVYAKRQVLVQ